MSAMPKILPLLAVAAAGVLAYKGLANAQVLPGLFAPEAAAEEAPRPAIRGPMPTVGTSAVPTPPAPPLPAVICQRSPAELAKEAGLSPAELATLQNLGARRGQLDAREQALDTQLQLINAASAKLDGKLMALGGLKGQIQALLGQADQQSQTEIDRLVTVYEKMKPADAGALMAALDDRVRVPVAAKIAETKPAVLAAIMSKMGTAEGKKLTELLAHRYTPAQTLQQALNGPPPAGSAPAATPPASGAIDAGRAGSGKPKPGAKGRRTVAGASTRPAAAPVATAAAAVDKPTADTGPPSRPVSPAAAKSA